MPAKIKYILLTVCAALFFLAAAYADLALRARSAFLKGERYMALAEAAAARGKASAGREPEPSALGDENADPAKYAYIWYRTAAEDFTPPETRWSRMARLKAPRALALRDAGKIVGKTR